MVKSKREDAVEILGKSPIFEGLDAGLLRSMVESLEDIHWPRHQAIIMPRQTMDRIYVLLEGRVKFSLHSNSGRELTLFLFGPGDAFNLENLLDRQEQPYFAQTLDEVDALSGPIELWTTWLETIPNFRRAFRKYLEQRLRNLTELAGDLALHDTMTRLVHLLLRYFDDPNGKRHSLIEDLTDTELASMIGTVRVVINRLLGELRDNAIIDTNSGKLRVLNLQKLLEKAEQHADHLSSPSL